ncbi:MAG: hypothetical protein PHT80_01785 [Lentisphaeria bacterium]|nr:hypothetical protein [Lentisphaeria bacterium]
MKPMPQRDACVDCCRLLSIAVDCCRLLSIAVDCCRLLSITTMKPAAAKVGGNQGRVAGRQRAVGFLQIVTGVFPTGKVTDRILRAPLHRRHRAIQ